MQDQLNYSARASGFFLRFTNFLTIFVVALTFFSPNFSRADADWLVHLPVVNIMELLQTPGDHQAFIDQFNAPTTKSITMSMFNLTDPDVIAALIAAAKRGVDVQIILDREHFANPNLLATAQALVAAGAKVVASTAVFNITHTKYVIINGTTFFITSINLTSAAATTLDLGVVGTDLNIVQEMLRVFATDWANGDTDLVKVSQEEIAKAKQPYQPPTPTNLDPYTPPLSDPNLVWSPTNAATKIVDLINSAQTSIIMTVENLRFQEIQDALVQAVARGVDVRVIVPQVDMNPDPNFNLPALLAMQNVVVNGKTVSVNSRMMPGPPSATTPYVHLKMIVVDALTIYIGSENFSYNSLNLSRELGIVFRHQAIAAKIAAIFAKAWNVSVPPKPLSKTDDEIQGSLACRALF